MFRFLLLLVILAALGVGATVWFFRVSLVERSLSKMVQSDVKIRDIKIGLNQVQLIGVTVEKSLFGTLFSASQIQASLDIFSLFSKQVKIEELRLENPKLKSEITKIIDKNALGSGSHTFIIEHVKMINLQDATTSKTLPYLEIHGIGLKKPLSAAEITLELLDRMAHALTHETAWGKMIQLYQPIENSTQDLYNKVTEQAQSGIDWVKSKIEESLELFSFFEKKE